MDTQNAIYESIKEFQLITKEQSPRRFFFIKTLTINEVKYIDILYLILTENED